MIKSIGSSFYLIQYQIFAWKLANNSLFHQINQFQKTFSNIYILQSKTSINPTLQAGKPPKPNPTSPSEDALNEDFDPEIVVNQDNDGSDGLESDDEYLFTESGDSDNEF